MCDFSFLLDNGFAQDIDQADHGTLQRDKGPICIFIVQVSPRTKQKISW